MCRVLYTLIVKICDFSLFAYIALYVEQQRRENDLRNEKTGPKTGDMSGNKEKQPEQDSAGRSGAHEKQTQEVPYRDICRTARKAMGLTQQEMANLLGVSKKAVQSYEQGWRNTPANVERLCLMYLVGLRTASRRDMTPCWEALDCPRENRDRCIVWRLQRGDSCWMFTGTYCSGEPEEKWSRKLEICRKCEVLKRIFLQGK